MDKGGGEEGEGEMNGERLCNNLEGWESEGRFKREGTIGTPMANSYQCKAEIKPICKAIILQLKVKKKKLD